MTPPDSPLPPPDTLARVPGLEGGASPLRIERLQGGSVNETWRVETAQGRFVLRIDGPEWRRPGVEREREQRLHLAAARAALAPGVRVWELSAGVRVCEYLDGRSWEPGDFLEPRSLRRLGERLSELHALPPPSGIAPFDPVACARDYQAQLGAAGAAEERTLRTIAGIDQAARQVALGTDRLSIVHGDLAHGNLLDGSWLWLLDWEYAQLADPLYDAACALAYYPAAMPQARALLEAAGHGESGTAQRLPAAIQVYRGLSELWHRARGEAAPAG